MRRCKACGEKHRSFEVCDKHHNLYSPKASEPLPPLGTMTTYATDGKAEVTTYPVPQVCLPQCLGDEHVLGCRVAAASIYPRCNACGRPRATCNLKPCVERLAGMPKPPEHHEISRSEGYRHKESSPETNAHYTVGEIECIDYIYDKLGPEGGLHFVLGNILKYATRAEHKDQLRKDLVKIADYANLAIARLPEGTP